MNKAIVARQWSLFAATVLVISTWLGLLAEAGLWLQGAPFSNGSFESPGGFTPGSIVEILPGQPTLHPWTIGGTNQNSVIGVSSGIVLPNLDFAPVDGNNAVLFNLGSRLAGDWIEQTFDTTPGQDFRVAFYVGRLGNTQGEASVTATVKASTGESLASVKTVPPDHGYGTAQRLTFTATTTSTTLHFRDTSRATEVVDLALDAVSVTPVRPVPHSQNLLVNGDFEDGNSGFLTEYQFARLDSGIGTYDVVYNPTDTHFKGASFSDHTSGAGLMLMMNGASDTNLLVWGDTVTVAANTAYRFRGWTTLLGTSNGAPVNDNPSLLTLRINGRTVLSGFQVTNPSGLWQYFEATWESGQSTNAVIQIRDLNGEPSGNDFVLDDLSFEPVRPAYCTAPLLGLVGWWPGDGVTNDLVTGQGAVPLNSGYAPGLVGQAFAFSGSNSFVRVPYSRVTGDLTNSLTLESWVWFNRTDRPPQRVTTLSPDTAYLSLTQGALVFSLALNGPATVLTATSAVAPHRWYHVVGTYDGTNQSLYVDGALAATANIGPPPSPINAGAAPELFISFLRENALDGMIDEVALYNRALSAAEVLSNFAAGEAGMCKQPRFTSILPVFPNAIRLGIYGPPLKALKIQFSDNLDQWSLLTTLTNFTGRAQVPDHSTDLGPFRFYRAVVP